MNGQKSILFLLRVYVNGGGGGGGWECAFRSVQDSPKLALGKAQQPILHKQNAFFYFFHLKSFGESGSVVQKIALGGRRAVSPAWEEKKGTVFGRGEEEDGSAINRLAVNLVRGEKRGPRDALGSPSLTL